MPGSVTAPGTGSCCAVVNGPGSFAALELHNWKIECQGLSKKENTRERSIRQKMKNVGKEDLVLPPHFALAMIF
jgi:hypothetical protein